MRTIKDVEENYYDSGPRPHYLHNSYYSNLVKRHMHTLVAPEKRKQEILDASLDLKSYRQIDFICKIFPLFIGVFIAYVIIAWINFGMIIPLIIGSAIILLIIIRSNSKKNIERQKQAILREHEKELSLLETKKNKAYSRILSAWDAYNVDYDGYPPDWGERRVRVKERDNWVCKSCGWPTGYKRKARNLNVHHIVPLSKGGDNSLSNLTTLCHICHRAKPGSGHSNIEYFKKPKGNKGNI